MTTDPDRAGRARTNSRLSLVHGAPASVPGELHVRSVLGGTSARPAPGATLHFGRRRDEVQVCVGENDRRVSRRHGTLTHATGGWWMANTGRLPIQLPGSHLLFPGDEPTLLTQGYTAAFIRGSGERHHLLELFVAGERGTVPAAQHDDETSPPRLWRISPLERVVLVGLAQRYLLQEANPAPLSWNRIAALLTECAPQESWTSKRVEHVVSGVRNRLSRAGVAGLTREEVGEPVGNALNDNLVRELLLSTTLVPPDLDLIDPDDD